MKGVTDVILHLFLAGALLCILGLIGPSLPLQLGGMLGLLLGVGLLAAYAILGAARILSNGAKAWWKKRREEDF